MKFAKELEDQLVAEWKDKYFDYKGAKKKLKGVARAMRGIESEKPPARSPFASLRDAPVYSLFRREQAGQDQPAGTTSQDGNSPLSLTGSKSDSQSVRDGRKKARLSPANEHSPLQIKQRDAPRLTRYGSIIGTPPEEPSPALQQLSSAPTLELPQPAIEADSDDDYDRPVSPGSPEIPAHTATPPLTQLAHTGNAYQITKPTDAPLSALSSKRFQHLRAERAKSTPDGSGGSRPLVRRMFSSVAAPAGDTMAGNTDVALEAYREVDFRQAEFFLFLDKELDKIESFYKVKEDEAQDRLKVLREQLHVMRDRRAEEILAAEQRQKPNTRAMSDRPNTAASDPHIGWGDLPEAENANGAHGRENGEADQPTRRNPFRKSLEVTREVLEKVRTGPVGKTSQAMEQLSTPKRALGVGPGRVTDPSQDYTRRPVHAVPYRQAKRKLKLAMAEYYRGLELLKSYALLNRTAFRKINKKYDKTVNASPKLHYVSEKVNKAGFVRSTTVDDLIVQVEDLYARYFERGNHKVAVSKLRAKIAKAGDFTGPIFRAGLLISAGAVFGFEGLVAGIIRLTSPDYSAEEQTKTLYLLQIYAGYLLMLFQVALFVTDAAIFTDFKVNYQFIFEFDPRNTLDWRQLAEMPTFFWFLLGFTMWCNFSTFGTASNMFIYWPVILIGLSALLLCTPPPLFYPASRRWFLTSNWRLLLAGVFPVEFRDFFLGDMYCSQTYALGNIELFFCLYAQSWSNPPMCNSSHSRLLGFFTTLPGIWRLLQCVRRYYDTRLWTHGLNGAKYTCTILQNVALSVWRIHRTESNMAFFLTCAVINSAYCSFWDLNYDWSMPLNPYSKPYPLLRPTLAYRKQVWAYYVAMLLDPILRFNWIFYVIFKDDLQHSSIVSFFVGFSEVLRRGMWVLFRVENEHCSNVTRMRAQRDPALPYELRRPDSTQEVQPEVAYSTATDNLHASPADGSVQDIERGQAPTTPATSLRQRRTGTVVEQDSPVYAALKRMGSTFMTAHASDYERKRNPHEPGKDDSDSEPED